MALALVRLLRVFDAVSGIAEATKVFRRGGAPSVDDLRTGGSAMGQLETRLAAVVVAALREAFDRDRARLDLERTHLDAERQRAEAALRLEFLRQVGDRALTEMRMIMGLSIAIWLTTALLVAWLPAMRVLAPKILLGGGWFALIASLACAFAAQNEVVGWLAASQAAAVPPRGPTTVAARWLFLAGLALTALSLLVAL